jgi:hypothetical protein
VERSDRCGEALESLILGRHVAPVRDVVPDLEEARDLLQQDTIVMVE